MARKPKNFEKTDTTEVLKDILIVQLGVAGVPQQKIRAIVGCDTNRVNHIVRHLKTKPAKRES